MILALAVLVGLLVAWMRFGRNTPQRLAEIPIHSAWLIAGALALQIPFLRSPAVPLEQLKLQQALFVGSFVFLLIFVGLNWRLLGAWVFGVGLVCNLVVILANGGAMPISPETLAKINPGSSQENWVEGQHYNRSKDVILLKENTRMAEISDIHALTVPVPVRAAFSLGDILIAIGIVLFMQDVRTPIPNFIRGDRHAA